jgi:hypothetical protein
MKDLASRREHIPADAVRPGTLAAVPANPMVTAGLGHGSPVGLGIAQALLAAVLALAAVVLKALGFAQGVILGTAGLVLVASGVLLVVWSDRDDRPRVANTPAETAYRSAA